MGEKVSAKPNAISSHSCIGWTEYSSLVSVATKISMLRVGSLRPSHRDGRRQRTLEQQYGARLQARLVQNISWMRGIERTERSSSPVTQVGDGVPRSIRRPSKTGDFDVSCS